MNPKEMQTDLQIILMDFSSVSLSNLKMLILSYLFQALNLKLNFLSLKQKKLKIRKKSTFGFQVSMLNRMSTCIGGMKHFIIFLNFKRKLIGNQNMFSMERPLTKIVMYIHAFVMVFFVLLNFVNYFSYLRWKNSRRFNKIRFETKINLQT